MRPEPFRVRFIPRSDTIRKLLLDEAAEAREALRPYDGETRVTMEDAVNNPARTWRCNGIADRSARYT